MEEIAVKHGLTPMIWSDMYFRLGSNKFVEYDLWKRRFLRRL